MLYTNFDRMFSDVWDVMSPLGTTAARPTRGFPVDVQESEAAYFLSFDVPGINKEDIKIEVQGDMLTVSGERKRVNHEDRHASVSERSYGFFSRTFTLPEAVDSAKIEASFENGVLEIAVPKAEAEKARRIEIQVGKATTGLLGKLKDAAKIS